jgi:acyl carrier protein
VNTSLLNDIRELIADIVEVEPEEVLPDSRMVQDLGADSMSALELMASLENKYNLIIDPEFLPEMDTLTKTAELIQKLLDKKSTNENPS